MCFDFPVFREDDSLICTSVYLREDCWWILAETFYTSYPTNSVPVLVAWNWSPVFGSFGFLLFYRRLSVFSFLSCCCLGFSVVPVSVGGVFLVRPPNQVAQAVVGLVSVQVAHDQVWVCWLSTESLKHKTVHKMLALSAIFS